MAESNQNLYKKLQRREITAKKRQATFISQYVFIKHFDIYQEAAREFNLINKIHPHKPDLTKSIEFKNWKRQLKGLPEIREHKRRDPCTRVIYPAITVHKQPEPEGQKVMQLRIPLIDLQSVQGGESIEVVDQGDTECLTVEKETTVNNNQVLEESDEVSGIQPSLLTDISPESMEQILPELRADPNLNAIMNNLETSIDEQLDTSIDEQLDTSIDEQLDTSIDEQLDIGMNVQITESLEQEIDDRFEKELLDMFL